MSWIKSDCSMSRHPKVNSLMGALGCSRQEAVGLLHIFWHWVMDFCEMGDISQYKDCLNTSLGYPKDYPLNILSALKLSGWVDDDNRVHDWLEYAYDFLYRKYHTSNPKKAELLTKEYRLTLGKTKGQPKVNPDKIRLDKIREDKKRIEKIEKIKHLNTVYLTQQEYTSLVEKNGKELIDKAIDVLDAYKLSKGKKYVSDAGALRSWAIEKAKTMVKYNPQQDEATRLLKIAREKERIEAEARGNQ